MVLAFLQDALGEKDPQRHAVYALASMGPWAKPAVPRLLELLEPVGVGTIDVVRDSDSHRTS